MELLKNWISTLCVVIVIHTIFAHIILPNSSIKKHVKFAFSLIILSVMLSPIIGLLTMNKDIDETVFQGKNKWCYKIWWGKKSLYDEEAILRVLRKT